MPSFIDLRFEDQLAVLTVNRPDRLNAMSNDMETQFFAALDEIDRRDDVR